MCALNHLSITVSVLPSIALYPHTIPVLILLSCPFTLMELGLLCVACYEMWWFCSLLSAIQ